MRQGQGTPRESTSAAVGLTRAERHAMRSRGSFGRPGLTDSKEADGRSGIATAPTAAINCNTNRCRPNVSAYVSSDQGHLVIGLVPVDRPDRSLIAWNHDVGSPRAPE